MTTGHKTTYVYDVTPNPKVRMTRRDTWSSDKVRPAVVKWRAFKTEVERLGITVQDGDCIAFGIPMPESWSAKKRAAHAFTPHRAKPDLDNLLGGLFDAAMPKGDQHIAGLGEVRKFWSYFGTITIVRQNFQAGA